MSETTKNPAATRFSLIELDSGPRSPEPKPEAPVAGVTVHQAAADENARLVAMANRAGFTESADDNKGTFFKSGTEMLGMGKAIARKERTQWEERPLNPDAMHETNMAVLAEKRRDISLNTRELSVDREGNLTRGTAPLALTDHSFRQLAGYAPHRGPLAYNINAWAPRSNRKVKVRARRVGEGSAPEAFAVVSPKYAACDLDTVARMVGAQLPKDARSVVEYDQASTRWQIDVSFANPHEIPEGPTVGALHRVGVRISGADNGSQSLRVDRYAERIRCINCTKLHDELSQLKKRHVGNVERLQALLRNSLQTSGQALAQFGELWSEANQRAIHDRYDGTPMSADETFRALIVAGYVKVPGVKAHDLHSKLMGAWEAEPGDTAAAVNRAITRMAHTETWSSRWTSDELEDTAGKMLYARVFSAPRVSDNDWADLG